MRIDTDGRTVAEATDVIAAAVGWRAEAPDGAGHAGSERAGRS